MATNRLVLASQALGGAIAGTYDVFGTNTGNETLLVYDGTTANLAGDFNRGGDTLAISGRASSFTIQRSGSNAVLTSQADQITVRVPVGVTGSRIVFENQFGQLSDVRTLVFDGTNVVLGTQVVGLAATVVTATPPAPPVGFQPVVPGSSVAQSGRLVFGSGSTASAVAGKYDVFGTNTGNETLTVLDGTSVNLAGDFNRGGDIIRLSGRAGDFVMQRSGSNVMISSLVDDITARIPVGVAGMQVVFQDGAGQFTDTRTLLFNGTNVVLGEQIVGLAAAGVTPLLNSPPVVASPIADQSVAEDTAWSYQLPANAFSDPDGDSLAFAASLADGSALPSWLSFNDSTRTFSGTPPLNFNGNIDVRVTASDGRDSVTDTFRLTITPVNDAPVITSTTTAAVDENAPTSTVVYRVTATDVDVGQSLTYSLAGADAGLFSINNTTGEVRLSASANYEAKQTYSFTVVASDGQAASSQAVSVSVRDLVDSLDVGAGDDSSLVTIDARGGAFDILDVNFQFIERVLDNNDVQIVRFGRNDRLSFDSDINDYSFSSDGSSLIISQNATGIVSRIVLDGLLSQSAFVTDAASANAALNAALGTTGISYLLGPGAPPPVTNTPPVLTNAIPDRSVAEDTAWSYQVPANTFSDADGNALTYTASLASGSALPSWLSFNSATRTFSGTPPLNFNGAFDLKVTASDGTASVSDTFQLTVTPVNDEPVAVADAAKATEDGPALTGSVATNDSDVDGDALTFAQANVIVDAGGPIAGLTLNSDGSYSFDPSNAAYQSLAAGATKDVVAYYIVSDGKGSTASSTLTIIVTGVNDAPVVASAIADQSSTSGAAWSYQVPAGAFSDVDGNILTYAATLGDGSALPSWLTFNSGTRTFSGAPPQGFNGTLDLRVTASDGSASVADEFRLTVASAPGSVFTVLRTALVNNVPSDGLEVALLDGRRIALASSNEDISYSTLDADTLALRTNQTIAQQYAQVMPSMVQYGSKAFLAYASQPSGYHGDEYGFFINSDGTKGTTLSLMDNWPGADWEPSLARFADGSMVMTFISERNGNYDIWAQNLDANGGKVGSLYLASGALPAHQMMYGGDLTAAVPGTKFFLQGWRTIPLSGADANGPRSIGMSLVNATTGTVVQTATVATGLAAFPLTSSESLSINAAGNGLIFYQSGGTLFYRPFSASTSTFTLGAAQSATLPVGGLVNVDVASAVLPNGNIATAVSGTNGARQYVFLLDINPANGTVGNSVTLLDQSITGISGLSSTDFFTSETGWRLPIDISILGSEIVVAYRDAAKGGIGVTSLSYTAASLNTPPVLANQIPDRTVAEDSAWSYQVPANTFSDADGNALTYTASLASGAALPSWLAFNASTRTFSGTPPLNFNGHIDLRVTASDGIASVNDDFRLTATPVNDPPNGTVQILAQKSILIQTQALETKVNTYSDGRQWLPAAAGLSDGGWIVTWESLEGPLSDWSVFGQRYDVRGNKLGSEFLINGLDSVNKYGQRGFSSSVIGTSDGGWLVSWTGLDQSGHGVFVKAYDRFGQEKSDAILINNTSQGDQVTANVDLALLHDNRIVQIYESFDRFDGAWRIYQRVLNENGVPLGPEVLVFSQFNGDQFSAHVGKANSVITTLSNNGWVIAWTGSASSILQDGGRQAADNNVFAQVFDQSGSKIGSEFQVNTLSDGNQNRPTVIGLDDGGFAIAWWSWSGTRPGDSGWDIYIQRFSSSGLRIGGEFRLNDYTGSDQHGPAVTRLNDGKIVFVWNSAGQDGYNEFGVTGRILDADLNKIGDEFIVNTYAENRQSSPSISALNDGGFIVAWQSNQNGQPEDIYSQRFDSRGNRLHTFTDVGFVPAFSSEYVSGALLQFDSSLISDADGLGALSVQWQRSTNDGLNWVNINGATGAQYQLGNEDVGGLVRARATYTDGSGFANEVLSSPTGVIAAASSNAAPVIANALPDRTVAEDTAWIYQVPANTFSDPDGETLTYAATLANGSPLPSWLTFNASTRTFNGTPPLNFNGNIDLRVTASGGTASVNDDFRLTITPVNDAPAITTYGGASVVSLDVPEDTTTFARVSASDADAGSVLTYSIIGGSDSVFFALDQASGLLRFANPRSYQTRTDSNGDGIYTVIVRASDGVSFDDQRFDVNVGPKGSVVLVPFSTTNATATAFVSADNYYDFYLNGSFISRDPGDTWLRAENYSVNFRMGLNTVGLQVENPDAPTPGGLIVDIDFGQVSVVSDRSWAMLSALDRNWLLDQYYPPSAQVPTEYGTILTSTDTNWRSPVTRNDPDTFPAASTAQWIWASSFNPSVLYFVKKIYLLPDYRSADFLQSGSESIDFITTAESPLGSIDLTGFVFA